MRDVTHSAIYLTLIRHRHRLSTPIPNNNAYILFESSFFEFFFFIPKMVNTIFL